MAENCKTNQKKFYNKSRKLWSPAFIDLHDYNSDSCYTKNDTSCLSTFVNSIKRKIKKL